MNPDHKPTWWRRLQHLFSGRSALAPEIQRAEQVLDAVDRGGMPLNPARINEVARNLGLEVSRKARVEDTIERIRAALERRPR